ncbi:hypothetical protein [Methylocapsa sp. S129]|uniref:hypothetical protein n=1 Tax=Methylocapsa sp. S129 TaxID=1641869 RepID=UPI00131C056B|nr:hypothetical protein [Methylocapsa sp. S129]
MSSSISSSDAADRRWRGFAVAFAATAVLLFAALAGVLAAVDPFDTGRFALTARAGVPEQGPRTADASRGRDPRFDSAIFGNSHMQLIRPETLNAQTGLDAVSMIVPGTYPKEQFVLIDWFLRHHPRPAAIVIGLDVSWCFDALYNVEPFPFWLYEKSPLAYLGGMMRYSALERIPGRLALLFGSAKPARADGYRDYDDELRTVDPGVLRQQLAKERPTASINPRNLFPAADRLKVVLAALSPSTAVVLAWPPVYITALPQRGSEAEATMRACHGAFSAVAAQRPRTTIVDWAEDRPETLLAENFFDQTHYRDNLAEAFQKDIASALSRMKE